MMNQSSTQQLAGARFRGLMIIWGAQLFSLALLFAVTQLIGTPVRAETNQTLLVALASVALATFALSFVMKSKLVAQAAAQRRPDLVTSGYVLAFALCEACAIFGVLLHFATGGREAIYFFVAAAVGLLLHFPRRRHVDDASGDHGQMLNTT
jgi:hypothetical protein